MSKQMTTNYLLNKHDIIINVSGIWDEFAIKNRGVNVCANDVCGHSIWLYVTGDVTRMWLNAIFQLARVGGNPIERAYRCDSPNLKRYMQMRLTPHPDGTLLVEHQVLKTEERDEEMNIRYKHSSTLAGTRQRCSVCGRIRLADWVEPLPEHHGGDNTIVVTYTVCEACRDMLPGL